MPSPNEHVTSNKNKMVSGQNDVGADLDDDQDNTLEVKYGIGRFKPRALQRCASSLSSFMFFYSISALATSTLYTYVNSQVTTLERQFGFSSSQTGLIMASNDIGYLSCIILFSYLALRVHIPRTVGILTVCFGLSGIICCLPHFLFGTDDGNSLPSALNVSEMTSAVKPTKGTALGQLCLLDGNRTEENCEVLGSQAVGVRDRDYSKSALILIVIGMMIQGACKSPRWPYLIHYVDGNIGDKTKTGFYLGIVVALAIFGPVTAFVLGGFFTRLYVTLQPTALTPTHPKWIGAWWLGFLAFGVFSLASGLPLFFFPRWMRRDGPKSSSHMASPTSASPPSSTAVQYEDRAKQMLKQIKEFPIAMWRLLTNPIYVLLVISSFMVIFSVGGQQAFAPKYVENQFSQPAWKANLVIAVTSMTTASFGSFAGGWLTRRFKMTPLGSIQFIGATQLAATVLAASGFFLKCEQPTIFNMPGGKLMNGSCQESCQCDDDDYLPVCGSDHHTYFSPCHAGCSVAQDENLYTNCTCVPDGMATAGVCDYGCSNLYVYAVVMAISAFCSCLSIMPSTLAFIRCVDPKDKALSVGVASFMTSLLGWLLGPIVFGTMIDGVCQVWERTCDGRGACLLYDNDLFRVKLFTYIITARTGNVLFIALAYLAAKVTKRLDGMTAQGAAGPMDF